MQVGDYQVLALIGEGGMGRVYRARHLRTEREVALKMRVTSGRDEEDAHRFVREGRYLASLAHPNVVRVYDAGDANGQAWIAMELIDGQSLGDRVQSGQRIAPADAARWIADAARGLAAIHALGIAHRDLKPDNIMIAADGVVKVMDFGLARGANATVLTAADEMVGTPAYIAPETMARAGDHRVDVWQLGVVFYVLLAGGLPFEARSLQDYLAQVMTEPILPLAPRAPTCPGALVALVNRMLERDPAARPSMTEVADAIDAALAEPKPRRPPAPKEPELDPRPLALGAALALAGLALGGAAFMRKPPAASEAQAALGELDRRIAAAEGPHLAGGRGAPRVLGASAADVAAAARRWQDLPGPAGWHARILLARAAAESAPPADVEAPLMNLRQAAEAGDPYARAVAADACLDAAAAAWLAGDAQAAEERYREASRRIPEGDERALRAAIGQVETAMAAYQHDPAALIRAQSALARLGPARDRFAAGFRHRSETLADFLFALRPTHRRS